MSRPPTRGSNKPANKGVRNNGEADCYANLGAAIVAHVVPYYHGWQVEGEWLDDWRDAVMAECDRLDERCREVRDGA